MSRIAVVLIALLLTGVAVAQKKSNGMRTMKPMATVCYASGKKEFANIGPPQEYLKKLRSGAIARTQSANIDVTYEGFSPEAQGAFQAAVEIWESLLETPVTIHVRAQWTPLGAGVLGAASPGTIVYNVDGLQKSNVWYPIALAERIAGHDLNEPGDADIVASFNSALADWNFSIDSQPAADKYDLMSIVMHEIGHGLGITHAYTVASGQGVISDFYDDMPTIFETGIRTGALLNIVNDFTPPSNTLRIAMTSNDLFYSSPLVRAANSNEDGKVYAPAAYNPGSSLAHLDETLYPAGSINSLMSPQIGMAERILDPGPIVKAILADMGWTGSVLKHTPVPNTESSTGPYRAVVKVVNTDGYDANSVKLMYRTTGQQTTTLTMAATGNTDEFAVNIPVGSATYSYFISMSDNNNRVFTNPSTLIEPGSAPAQQLITFTAGPDTQPPVITHTPKEFITPVDGLEVDAVVTDNLEILNVKLIWQLNGVAQPDEAMTLKAGTSTTYEVKKAISGLEAGDKIEYRIRAEDMAIAHNVAFKPSPTTFFEVGVAGLGETKNSYANNFDNLSTADFFGNGFSISQPSGFSNGAIHSDHPYAAAGAGSNLSLIYNLKVPIRVARQEAVIKFDEIVLVEPGEAGAPWPDEDFYDYVVVEGSKDGGVTWTAIADGYDSRANSTWNNIWNSTLSNDNNSTGVGAPTMYRSRTLDLLSKFAYNDEVAIRFRLFSDPFSFGWGWSIDNLKIQVDDVPPRILHQHKDFVLLGTNSLNINTKITDNKGVEKIFVDYRVNGGAVTTTEVLVSLITDTYTQTIDLSTLGLKAGDEFQYKIRATDVDGNAGAFPSSGFINTVVISLSSPIDQFVTDFNIENADITGNFFSIAQPSGFTNAAMTSIHPYPVGLDIDLESDFSWMIEKPVKVSATNSRIYFEEEAIVEYDGTSVKDYVVVEASKDGVNWEQLLTPYAANAFNPWRTIFDNGTDGVQGSMQSRLFDITTTGKFKAGDVILIRFRLHSDAAATGWGWLVDNLSIQGPVTGIETAVAESAFVFWPNSITDGTLHLSMYYLQQETEVKVEILTTQGQVLSLEQFSAPAGESSRDFEISDLPQGFYLMRVQGPHLRTVVQKVIKLR